MNISVPFIFIFSLPKINDYFFRMHWIIVSVIALQNYPIAPPSIQPALISA